VKLDVIGQLVTLPSVRRGSFGMLPPPMLVDQRRGATFRSYSSVVCARRRPSRLVGLRRATSPSC